VTTFAFFLSALPLPRPPVGCCAGLQQDTDPDSHTAPRGEPPPPGAGLPWVVAGYCNDRVPAHPDPPAELAGRTDSGRCRVLRPLPTPLVRTLSAGRGSLQGAALMGLARIRSRYRNLRRKTNTIGAGSLSRFRRERLLFQANPADTEKKLGRQT
jgi:hypothetical protein